MTGPARERSRRGARPARTCRIAALLAVALCCAAPSATAGTDAYELERRLGHRAQRYIQRYTNPPEAVAAAYVEEF